MPPEMIEPPLTQFLTALRIDRDAHLLTVRQLALLDCIVVRRVLNVSLCATSLDVPRPTVTRATDRLVEYGLVERTRIAEDRRAVILQPTGRGLAFHARMSAAFARRSAS